MGKHGITGIERKWEQEWEQKVATGTWRNHCYLSDSSRDSLPIKITHAQLCKPSHKYSIMVKFFLSHNKHQPTQSSISTDAICDVL